MAKVKKPEQLENVDLSELRETCQDYIDYLSSKDFSEDNDFDQYIFEKALEAVFGKDIWAYVNSRLK